MNSRNLLMGTAALATLALLALMVEPKQNLMVQTPHEGKGAILSDDYPPSGSSDPTMNLLEPDPRTGRHGMRGLWGPGGPYAGIYAAVSLDEAVDSFKRYIVGRRSNLRLLEVMEFQHNFYAAVGEGDSGIGAFELLLWKRDGRITPEPGPNMMWNLKYGMGMIRSYGEYTPRIEEDEAKGIALSSLRELFPNHEVAIESGIPFYGYYTFDYSVEGRMTGMLSVNAFTGEIWYHTWHGYFIEEVDD